tara:strand:+ start:147 stop:581 length:435 start_codon:yes stop_codon:yes gene_type:complete
MNLTKLKFKFMFNKFPLRKYEVFGNFSFNKNFLFRRDDLKNGLIYTLYSDKSNLIEVGFVQSNKILENKLIQEKFILLDKKKGSLKELRLLKKTLKQLGLLVLNNKYYKYTELLIRHLHILGWPVGKSLYKHRVIKKKISYAIY